MISVQQTDTTDTTHADDAHTFTSGHGGNYCEVMITHRDDRGSYRLPCNELRDHPRHQIASERPAADTLNEVDVNFRELDDDDDDDDDDEYEALERDFKLWQMGCLVIMIYLIGVVTGLLL